jgi:hypothetical protein
MPAVFEAAPASDVGKVEVAETCENETLEDADGEVDEVHALTRDRPAGGRSRAATRRDLPKNRAREM